MPALLQRATAQPAGRGGIEELLLAGETLRSSRLFKQAREAPQKREDVLLALKRRMLLEPPVIHALELLKAGVDKAIAPGPPAADAAASFLLLDDLAAL